MSFVTVSICIYFSSEKKNEKKEKKKKKNQKTMSKFYVFQIPIETVPLRRPYPAHWWRHIMDVALFVPKGILIKTLKVKLS